MACDPIDKPEPSDRRGPHRLTRWERRAVVDAVRDGDTQVEAARRFGISQSTVSRILASASRVHDALLDASVSQVEAEAQAEAEGQDWGRRLADLLAVEAFLRRRGWRLLTDEQLAAEVELERRAGD